MTLTAFEGPAGCGKTFRLMELLAERMAVVPLVEGQRVLALTFMHGARRRLVDRLANVAGLKGRVDCSTIDGFAWRLVRRWRGLVSALGIPNLAEEQFDQVCDTAGLLLEQPAVRSWVANSFPVVLIDEGQDLHPQRLRMLIALAEVTDLLAAADGYQCLDATLNPNPFIDWIQAATQPQVLTQVHRTNVAGLLNAAAAIRGGQAPVEAGQHFRVMVGQSVPLAAAMMSNAIGWHADTNDIAIITPSRTGGFAQKVVDRVGTTASNHGNGPYSVAWEGSDDEETRAITAAFNMAPEASGAAAIAALHLLPRIGPIQQTIAWVNRQIHAAGRTDFTRLEIETMIRRFVTMRRQHGGRPSRRFNAMTVHQAKNREFDGVVVIWPHTVAGSADQKRRLLYNAVSRARKWCNVIVQSQNIRNAPPFL